MSNPLLLIIVLLPMAAAFICYAAGHRSKPLRNNLVLIFAAAELCLTAVCCVQVVSHGTIVFSSGSLVGASLNFEMDGFRVVYSAVVAVMWMNTLLFSREYFEHYHNRNRYYFFNLLTLGATMGVFLSADLYTTFVFFEIMSFTSYTWVIHEETEASIRAANTYLAVAVIGGLVALMGLFILDNSLGTLKLSDLYAAASALPDRTPLYIAGGCILFGFGAKAGMFPLHIWLPKAHPVAPAPASALLSGILTKSGVFGILAVSCNILRNDPAWGTVILTLGTVTMVLGAVLALLSIDLKRTLACSSMSQIGFILVGVGMMGLLGAENTLAARGALLHMVNHSTFKLLLFMVAGTVYMRLHALDLNEIRGFGRNKPLLHALYLAGALGIGGIPLFSGYVSKTLLHESLVEYTGELAALGESVFAIKAVEWLFLISGGLTLAYMTKLYVAIFVEKNATRQAEYDTMRPYMTKKSAFAMLVPAVLIPIAGILPHLTMDRIADLTSGFFHASLPEEAVAYFSIGNLKGAAISLLIGAAVYFIIVRRLLMKNGRYVNVIPPRLDLEELIYRPLLLRVLPSALGFIARVFGENLVTGFLCKWAMRALAAIGRLFGDNVVTGFICRWAFKLSLVLTHMISDLTDAAALMLRRTLFRESVEKSDDHYSRSLAYKTGNVLDGLTAAARRRGSELFSERFVRIEETVSHTTRRITQNLSFALLMLCIALCAAFIYLLLFR